MSQLLYRLGRFSARNHWRVIALWFLAAAAVVVSSGAFGADLDDSFKVPGVDSERALQLLSDAQSEQAGTTARVVLTPTEPGASFFDSPAAVAALTDVQAAVDDLPNVLAVSDAAAAIEAGEAAALESGVFSPDGSVAVLQVQYPLVENLDITDFHNLEELVADRVGDPDVQVEAGGELFFTFDEPETGIGEAMGIVIAIIILLLAFGSLIAMGLPIGMALFGLALGVSAMPLVTHLYEIPGWAPAIGAMVGLGVGIDYALFLVTRHREFLAEGMTVEESAGRAVATAGQAVVFAGGTVVIAILGLAFSGVPALTGAGIATSVLVLIMVVSSITLLPAFLGLAGHWINRLGIHRRGIKAGDQPAVSPRWQRWGAHVSNHAAPYAVGVTVLLLALTAPILGLRLGFPDDGTQAESTTTRRAYDLAAEGFGPGINGPLLIAVDISNDEAIVGPLTAAIASDAGIASVAPPALNPDAGVATVIAIPTTAPQDRATVDTIARLRSDVFPAVLGDSPATAHVGGQSASFADIAERVSDRLPIFIVAVILLSFVLLTMVFRSIVVPIKAAILNLLSIGAAYGVLVAVFQWGWGIELLGLESTVPIVSFIPMFMFAILFGLSMDYEVFLLSRVREEYLATGDNDASVIHGIAGTARVITSAALIMIAVFGGFVMSDDPVTKMFGLGLATAIAVDATIVRLVLVPATMKLMGDANWWLPGWLDRILPTIDIEGETALPEPAYELGQHPEVGPVPVTSGGADPLSSRQTLPV